MSTLSVLVASASRFGSTLAERAVQRLSNQLTSSQISRLQVYVLWRIGAASLSCGTYFISVKISEILTNLQLNDELNEYASNRAALADEAGFARLYGSYLGESGEDSLANYASFSERLRQYGANVDVPT